MGKHYSIKFKYQIVKLILENDWGIREVTQQFRIGSHASVSVWLQRFEKYGINGLNRQSFKPRNPKMPKTKNSKPCHNPQDIKALLKELEYLRAENAVLKSLSSWTRKKFSRKKRHRQRIKKNNIPCRCYCTF